MLEIYNPHPQQKLVGDCVKRAFTKATGKTYQEVSKDLNRIKREQSAKAYNSNSVWKAYAEELSAVKLSFPAESGKKRMDGHQFCETHPEGSYVLRMAGHLSSCVNGVIYDTWDCRDKCVYIAYKIPDESTREFIEETRKAVKVDNNIAASSPSYEYFNKSGEYLIYKMSELTGCPVKKTKKGELWISLTDINYDIVLHELLNIKHLRWETKRGSAKSKIWDEQTHMTLILKNQGSQYLWCTHNGEV